MHDQDGSNGSRSNNKPSEDLSTLFDRQRESFLDSGTKGPSGGLRMGGSLGFGFRGTIPKMPSFKIKVFFKGTINFFFLDLTFIIRVHLFFRKKLPLPRKIPGKRTVDVEIGETVVMRIEANDRLPHPQKAKRFPTREKNRKGGETRDWKKKSRSLEKETRSRIGIIRSRVKKMTLRNRKRKNPAHPTLWSPSTRPFIPVTVPRLPLSILTLIIRMTCQRKRDRSLLRPERGRKRHLLGDGGGRRRPTLSSQIQEAHPKVQKHRRRSQQPRLSQNQRRRQKQLLSHRKVRQVAQRAQVAPLKLIPYPRGRKKL